jgi:hypothetical protein
MPTAITNRLANLGIQATEIPLQFPLSTDLKPKSASEVATRLVILSYMIGVYYDVDAKDLVEQLKKYKLFAALTPHELEVLSKKEYDDQDIIDAGWLQECIEVLAWALGMNSKPLDHATEASVSMAVHIPVMKNPEKFIQKAALVSQEALFEEYSILHHLYHYLQNEEHLLLDADIILERYRAINWVCGATDSF